MKNVRRVYANIARDFDRSRGPNPWKPLEEFLAASMDAGADIRREGGVLLDCGCGNGRNKAALVRNFACRHVGLDLAGELLEAAIARDLGNRRERARAREQEGALERELEIEQERELPRAPGGSKGDYVRASMTHLPFRDSCIDVVASIASINHIPSISLLGQAFADISRVTRSGGLFVYSAWRKWIPRFRRALLLARVKRFLGIKVDPNRVDVSWKESRSGVVHERPYYLYGGRKLFAMTRPMFKKIISARLGGPGKKDNLFVLLKKR